MCEPSTSASRKRRGYHDPDSPDRGPAPNRRRRPVPTFRTGLRAQLDPQAFFKAKRIEQDEHPPAFPGHALQPGAQPQGKPRGLRDLQIILWVAQAAGYGPDLGRLRSAGFVTDEEYEHLVRCESTCSNDCASACTTS